MRLTDQQVARYERDGFLILPGLFSDGEVALLDHALEDVVARSSEADIREKDSGEIRTAMGLHLRSEVFANLVRHPRLLVPAMQLAGDALYVIPGSHRRGPTPATLDSSSTSYPLWVNDRDRVRQLVAENGLVAATGPAGTALIFGDCLVHASPANISPWDRRIFSLIVNPVGNALTRHQRPDYKHHRDLTPIVPLADDCLAAAAVPAGF